MLFFVTLVAIALLCAGWYLYEHCWDRSLFAHRSETDFVINVRARKAAALYREGVTPIDVRPAPSFRAGHLPKAINAPFEGMLDSGALDGLDRTRPVLVYCDGGYRSRRSLPALRAAGFTAIYHLHRGLMSWKMAKEPTESGPAT
jgi:rhodanese-related sulfurtransferase